MSDYLLNQWRSLSFYEQTQLQNWVTDSHAVCAGTVADSLEQKGIVKHGFNSGWTLTEFGRAIFDAAQPDAPAERPSTITAGEFVGQGYAAKIAAGECKVWHGNIFVSNLRYDETSEDYGLESSSSNKVPIYYVDDETRLTVAWLAPAPASEREAGDAPSVNVFAAYVEELEATVATLQAELTATRQQLAAAGALLPCPDCEGDGVIAVGFDDDPNIYEAIENECPRCKGTGKYTALQATPQPAPSDLRAAVAEALTDLEAIATGMTGDLTPANVANIALSKLAAAFKAGE